MASLRAIASASRSTPYREFGAGARAILPLVIGAIPFGLIFGTLSAGSGLSFAATVAMSAFVFAGSAQFIAIGLISTGTAISLIFLTTFVVNLRHLLYAASLLPHVRALPTRWRLSIGFFLTDECFVVAIARYNQTDPSPYKHWYYLGAALCMYLNWQLSTILGLTLGTLIPDATQWGLDFAMSATFIGMVIPYLVTRPMVATVIVAGGVSLLAHGLPHQLGLMVAALAGVAAGQVTSRISQATCKSEGLK